MSKREVSVGIIGFGTVGSGTARILLENSSIIKSRTGFDVKLKRIADKDITTEASRCRLECLLLMRVWS